MFRYRRLDANGDYSFGRGGANFLVDSPAAVAQSILTRLELMAGEWFLDVTAGTDYTAILGTNTGATRDAAVKEAILGTFGVTALVAYSSSVVNRKFTVTATVSTIFSSSDGSNVTIQSAFPR